MIKEIPSIYRQSVKTKFRKLLDLFKQSKSINVKQWCIDIITLNNKVAKGKWDSYLKGDLLKIWTDKIPEKMEFETEGELENYFDKHLMYFMCYLQSIFTIDHYFTHNENFNNYIILYNGSTRVSFFKKLMHLCPYEKFTQIPLRKLEGIFIQLDLMIGSIDRGIDDEYVQDDIAMSIVTTVTVATQVNEVSAHRLRQIG